MRYYVYLAMIRVAGEAQKVDLIPHDIDEVGRGRRAMSMVCCSRIEFKILKRLNGKRLFDFISVCSLSLGEGVVDKLEFDTGTETNSPSRSL